MSKIESLQFSLCCSWSQIRTGSRNLDVLTIEMRQKPLDAKETNTPNRMINLALKYQDQSRWKEEEDVQILATKLCFKVLGHEHPDTLTSMDNLPSTYRYQDR